MGFLAPLMLLGGAAVSVPIALHFFYKARYRPLPWAAMRFLKQSIEQTSRRLQFQEWILLVLRCLCLLLLALAMARPSCALLGDGRGESVDAVFVFDTSYSMGAQDGEKTRWERAQEAALGILDHLPGNSTVQIITNADRAADIGPRTPSNLDEARNLIQALTLTSLAGDVLPGLDEAYNALDRGTGTNKEVYLFTDLQKSGWERQAGAVKAKAAEIQARASFIIVRCGNPERPVQNVSIADITYPGGIPHSKTRLPVTVLLRNTGSKPVRDLTVTLDVDGRAREKESATIAEIPGGQSYPVTLTAKLDLAGPRLLTATVNRDDLPGDNRLDRIIPVRDRLRVLIVDGAPDPRDPKESGSHFLRNALLPVAASAVDEYFVRVTVVPPEEAGPGLLGVNDLCVLCNVAASSQDRPGIPGLSPDFVAKLPTFVQQGGGLIIGAGDHVIPKRYNAILGSTGVGILPFPIAGIVSTTPDKPFRPAPDTTESPGFISLFREEPYSTVTADVELFRFLDLQEDTPKTPQEETAAADAPKGETAAADAPKPRNRVLMRLANGKPWLTAQTIGEGEVVFITSPLDATWGNWPAKAGSYLSFVQFTLSHLTGQAAVGANQIAGRPLTWRPTTLDPAGYELILPNDRREKITTVHPGDAETKPTVTVPETLLAGVYRIEALGQPLPESPRLAVAPDLAETDNLDVYTAPDVESLLGFEPVLVLAGDGTSSEWATLRSRREWTIWLLLGLFVVAVGESGWAWMCGRAW
ncbi:MAG: BatA domain-containing protein [Bacteroidales bacterium]|nr:BatA domain-containing protein [Bacteroidales bacterium]